MAVRLARGVSRLLQRPASPEGGAMPGARLTDDERLQIETLWRVGRAIPEIAEGVGRHRTKGGGGGGQLPLLSARSEESARSPRRSTGPRRRISLGISGRPSSAAGSLGGATAEAGQAASGAAAAHRGTQPAAETALAPPDRQRPAPQAPRAGRLGRVPRDDLPGPLRPGPGQPAGGTQRPGGAALGPNAPAQAPGARRWGALGPSLDHPGIPPLRPP